MEQPAKLLFAACLTMIIAATLPGGATAAENEAPAQDLVQVKTSDQVMAARWVMRPDSYVLQVVLDPARYTGRAGKAANPPVAVAGQERPPNPAIPVPPGGRTEGASPGEDRGRFFIGNTIANLRGLSPWFTCGRTLSLIDARRPADGPPPAPPSPEPSYVKQPWPPRFKDSRVEVWLLKADGTQILPTTYGCDAGPRPPTPPAHPVEISYEFTLADGGRAVAAVIRIDDSFYIDKLQSLVAKPVSQ